MKIGVVFTIAVFLSIVVVTARRSKVYKPQDDLNLRNKREDKTTSIFGDDIEEDAPVPVPLSVSRDSKKKYEPAMGFLPLPPGYNKLVIPLANVSSSIFVMFHMSIREILDVDTNSGILELDTELGITWIDWEVWKYFLEDKEARERAMAGPEVVTLDAEFLKQIWKPDIFIEEMAGVEKTFLLSKLITLHFLVKNPVMPGAIDFRSRQTFKVRCDMDFTYFPADTQKCTLNIRSYSYPEDKLFLVWNPSQKIFLDNIQDSNYDMQVSNVEPGEELYDLFTTSQAPCCTHQNYSTLTFTLQLRRSIKYHLIQTCLPSILLIFITWLCFLIPTNLVEARIGISMTTLLTLTAMFTSVREQSPQVSYTMAIDIWMVFCMLILFVALVLFTVIYWMRRRLERIRAKTNGVDPTAPNVKTFTNGDLPSVIGTDSEKVSKVYIAVVTNSKKTTFILFAFIFVLFLIFYGSWVMTASGYLEWEPSATYNAIPIEDADGKTNDTNRLFTKQEKKFRANSTKKTPESAYRFRDIFKKVISPKLLELEEEEGGDEEYEETESEKNEESSKEKLDKISSEYETTTGRIEVLEKSDSGETEANSTTMKNETANN